MIKPDEQEELLTLSRARVALSPSPADVLRVRNSLTAALAAPVSGGGEPGLSGGDLAPGAGWPLRVLVTSVAAAAVGAGGYWMGHRAGVQEARFITSPPAFTSASVPPPKAPSEATAAAPRAWQAQPTLPIEPIEDTPAAREVAKRRLGKGARATRSTTDVAATESLAHEVRALRSVERALRDHDPRLALAILQQLDRAVPGGKLVEERRATAIMARCAAGDGPFGVNLAEDFASDYPESVYLGRVEQSCAPPRRDKGQAKRSF